MENKWSTLFFIGMAHLFLGGTLILVTAFARQKDRRTQTLTVARMATVTRLIPVTNDTFDTPNMYGSSKAMTVTRMATATRLILVTVETFDRPNMYGS